MKDRGEEVVLGMDGIKDRNAERQMVKLWCSHTLKGDVNEWRQVHADGLYSMQKVQYERVWILQGGVQGESESVGSH